MSDSVLDREESLRTPTPAEAKTTPWAPILIIVYLLLLGAALCVANRLAPFDAKSGFENFGKIAAVFVTAATALMAAVVTIINFDRNAKEVQNLARINGEISQQLVLYKGDIDARLIRLNSDISKSLADYKSELDQKLLVAQLGIDIKLERWKTAFSKEINAYIELMNAANATYYALAKLERGEFEKADKDKFDETMAKANANTGLLHTQAHVDLWEVFWNRANYIAESAEALGSHDLQPNLWRQQAGEFAEMFRNLQRIVTEKIHGQIIEPSL